MSRTVSWLVQLRQFAGRRAALLALGMLLAALAPSLSAAAAAPVDADCENCHTLPSAEPCLMTASGGDDTGPGVAGGAAPAPRTAPPVLAVLATLPPMPAVASALPARGVAATASATARVTGQPPTHLRLGRLRN